MSSYNKTYSPCDDCQYSYSKNGQEMSTCNICEYKHLQDSWENSIKQIVEQLGTYAIEFEAFGQCSDYVELSHAIDIIKKGGAE